MELFYGKSEQFIEKVLQKVRILSSLQILWMRTKYFEEGNEIFIKDIDYCKNYLIESVPKINLLDF